jgi:carboxylate-amine ligase
VRALAVEAAAGPPPSQAVTGEALDWSSFRALRDGVDARILDRGELRPLANTARDAVDRIESIADEHGDGPALGAIEHLLATRGSARRQRRAFAEGGMRRLLRHLVDETDGVSGSRTTTEEAVRFRVR